MADNKNLKEKDLNNISGGWSLTGKYNKKKGKNTITLEYSDEEIGNIPGLLGNLVGPNTQPRKCRKCQEIKYQKNTRNMYGTDSDNDLFSS